MTPERLIENAILDWCAIKGIKVWKIKSVGTFDPVEKRFRRPNKRYKLGVSDILGIYRGRPLAIEVKSKTGRLNENQKIFLKEWEDAGGISIVARSVDEVEQALKSSCDLSLNNGDASCRTEHSSKP